MSKNSKVHSLSNCRWHSTCYLPGHKMCDPGAWRYSVNKHLLWAMSLSYQYPHKELNQELALQPSWL